VKIEQSPPPVIPKDSSAQWGGAPQEGRAQRSQQDAKSPQPSNGRPASAWSPLRHPVFRALWIASLVSSVGTYIHDVGAAWLMTSLAPSPLMVALVQTATALPIMLLALPAGALADVVDRRKLLLSTQAWMLAVSLALAALTLSGATTPWLLLGLTFALGIGTAMYAPAWQATTPELVSRRDLPQALVLGGVAINLARAVGPALGGLLVAAAGSGAAFLLNGISFLGVMAALYAWRRAPRESSLPSEHLLGAIRAGLRYVSHAPPLRAVLIRTAVFILCGSALWAILPLLARREMAMDAFGYGFLLGCLGAGAVGGAAILPSLRRRLNPDALSGAGALGFALVTLTLALVRSTPILGLAMFVGGVAWMSVMSSLNLSAQTAVPAWVRARALAVYLLVFQSGLAAGSVVWGLVASSMGIPDALTYAAIGLVGGLAFVPRYRLQRAQGADLRPAHEWAPPVVAQEPEPDRGTVLVTVEYLIDPERASEFREAMRPVRRLRLRDGAIYWDLVVDVADPRRRVELFVCESWAEHLRQHERFTVADRDAHRRARSFHIGEQPPVVYHFLSDHLSKRHH
jgi:MFS family permease